MLIISKLDVNERTERMTVLRTEVGHVEDLRIAIFADGSVQLAIGARGNSEYGRQMCPVMLHKLNAKFLFLPQFQVSIDRGGNDKVCSGELSVVTSPARETKDSLRHVDKIQDISVHETLGIAIGVGQVLEEYAFMRQN